MKPLAVNQVRDRFTIELWVGDQTKPSTVLDFHAAGFSETIAEKVARAFISLAGGTTYESQMVSWRHTRRFAEFIAIEYGSVEKFPRDCLERFGKQLADSDYALRTAGAAYNVAHNTLSWLRRNAPETTDRKIRLDRGKSASKARRESQSKTDVPSEELMKKILNCCYSDILEWEAAREKIRLVALSEVDDEFSSFMLFLLIAGGGMLPTPKQLASMPGGKAARNRLADFGRVREIYSQYYISIEELFAHYLAILVQASANPQPLRLAEMECIMPVPFREDIERLVWDKPRSRRMQVPDFPKAKEWSATNIARRLLAKNAELRHLAPAKYKNALFICRTVEMNVTVPSWQTLHNCLTAFREKHNLPQFDFSELRRAGGALHHKVGRSILTAQQRLQHKSSKVTQGYTPLTDLLGYHQSQVRRFQGMMVAEAERFKSGTVQAAKITGLKAERAETLFGFQCKDPLAGIADGSRQGVPCPKFDQCSGCTGAIVVVDDPRNVAKLINAITHLAAERERALKEGWSKRFDLLYQPTVDILKNDILPAISKSIWEKAILISPLPLPHLE